MKKCRFNFCDLFAYAPIYKCHCLEKDQNVIFRVKKLLANMWTNISIDFGYYEQPFHVLDNFITTKKIRGSFRDDDQSKLWGGDL